MCVQNQRKLCSNSLISQKISHEFITQLTDGTLSISSYKIPVDMHMQSASHINPVYLRLSTEIAGNRGHLRPALFFYRFLARLFWWRE